jgi:hypothetical protein
LSPILVRPVREQLEHDRVIRLLQAKYKRKFDVAINPGNEQTTPVGSGPSAWYPDLVLQSAERGRKLLGVVEVETAESVNNLEAMSQWVAFSKLKVPFHLYVPVAGVDSARRLCTDLDVAVAELWAYHAIGDQLRFTLVHRTPQAADGKAARVATEPALPARERAAAPASARPAAASRPARQARPAPARAPRRAGQGAAASRRPAAKGKTPSPRRAAAKTTGRKSTASRAQKRR